MNEKIFPNDLRQPNSGEGAVIDDINASVSTVYSSRKVETKLTDLQTDIEETIAELPTTLSELNDVVQLEVEPEDGAVPRYNRTLSKYEPVIFTPATSKIEVRTDDPVNPEVGRIWMIIPSGGA